MDTEAGSILAIVNIARIMTAPECMLTIHQTGPSPVVLLAGSLHSDFCGDHTTTPGYKFPLPCILTVLLSYTSYFQAFIPAVCSPLHFSSWRDTGCRLVSNKSPRQRSYWEFPQYLSR